MRINLKTKIWLTVFSIVLLFTFFTLFYFPAQQRKLLIKNYNTEVQNLANSVALGVNIALTDQNFKNLGSTIKLVKDDPRLQFVSMVQFDTVWSSDRRNFQVKKIIFNTFPETEHPDPDIQSNNSIIVKRGTFNTQVLSGVVLLAFTTKEINESQRKIRFTSLIVSGIVLIIGILLGFQLARKISIPILALRDAAKRVGEGDLSQKVKTISNDEIGELGKAFNGMVDDLLRARKELDENNQTLSRTNTILNNTLLELKSTQVQLIQSEKMASLGELTAGIAHEIQNPLNFVNNFSEVNQELIEEMKHEIDIGNIKEAKLIADIISQNEEKILNHGKRADGIVKGMLQHSRRSNGQKELTDINALADEYLRLSYHGFRAKDKTFNSIFKTDFDNAIDKIYIIPQEVGRVLLNLYNNAFYSVNEKKRQIDKNPPAGQADLPPGQGGFEPVVSVRTRKLNDKIEISVHDNGIGIPQKVLDKIYQPFFTTKPTGQGTGLGLSLSYDIIKAHGGEIRVRTKENEGAEFLIILPLTVN
jgi:two-component system NtrC family sensor kinase